MRLGIEPWRAPNPMQYQECGAGFVQRGTDDAPLRIFVEGDEEEIIRQCVNEMRCWNCHERWPAPVGLVNLPLWRDWGNPTEPDYDVRRRLIAGNCCPICTAPSAPQMILNEIQDMNLDPRRMA